MGTTNSKSSRSFQPSAHSPPPKLNAVAEFELASGNGIWRLIEHSPRTVAFGI
jgi:hypothetical protein